MLETFKKWYDSLSASQQKELLEFIFNNKIRALNEGVFTGPLPLMKRGLFTGPSNSKDVCPTCKRPY